MEKLNIKDVKVSSGVKEYIDIAFENGYSVYGFQKNEEITQVFIESLKGICTVHNSYSDTSISTIHKPCRQCGTGFRLEYSTTIENDIETACSMIAPARNDIGSVIKWKSFAEKARNSISNYFEITLK